MSTVKRLTKELVDQELKHTRIFNHNTIFMIKHLELYTHLPSYKNKKKLTYVQEKELRVAKDNSIGLPAKKENRHKQAKINFDF